MDNATTDKYLTKVSSYLNRRLSNFFPSLPFDLPFPLKRENQRFDVFRASERKTGKKWVNRIVVLYFKTEVTRKQSMPNFPKNKISYPLIRTHTCTY